MHAPRTVLRSPVVLAALVFVVAFLTYSNTIGHAFVWDDVALIPDNPRVRTLDWETAYYLFTTHFWHSTGKTGGLYRPLVNLSYHMDYQLFGLGAGGYHLTNVVIHAGVSTLAFVFLLILLGERWLALLASLMFATMPLHTENVAWIAGRSDLLAMLWMLAALIAFVLWRRVGVVFLLVSIVCLVLALLSKELAMITPALVLAVAAGPFRLGQPREGRALPLVYAVAPYAAAVVAFAIVRGRILDSATTVFEPLTSGPAQAVALSLSVIGRYAYKLLFPFSLNAELEFPVPESLADPHVFVGGLLIATTVFALIRWRRSGGYVVGLTFLLVGLLPVAHIVPMPETSAERFLYMPSFGFSIVVAALLVDLARRRRFGMPVATALAAVIVVTYGARTFARNLDWKDEATLYSKTVRSADASARAHLNLGKVHYKEGRYPQAAAEIRRALEIDPEYAGAWSTLAGLHRARGEMSEAMAAIERALRIEPHNANFLNSLGVLYIQQQRYAEAQASFRAATEYDPGNARAIFNLALAHYMSGNKAEALANFERVPFKDDDFPHAYFYLAVIAAESGDRRRAASEAEKFLSIYDKDDSYRERARALIRGENP